MMFPRKAIYLFIASIVMVIGCSLYDSPRNASRFISAKLTNDKTVIFSFNHSAYRMAKGIAAFPDGGKAKYVKDVNILGAFHVPSGHLTILCREENTEWQGGQGHFSVMLVNGPIALVSQSGQHSRTYRQHTKYFLVNIQTKHIEQVPFREDMATRGNALSEIYLIDTKGTILFVSPSIKEDERQMFWRRDISIVPEIWIRYPDGEYVKIAKTRHYERVDETDVIYWVPDTRTFKAFNISTRQTRTLQDYTYPPYQDITECVNVSTHGEHLSYGTKVDDMWQYKTIQLTSEMLCM